MTRARVLRLLLHGVAGFFLVMAVVDPVVQLGFQQLEWSAGLVVEVAFFVPAGLALLLLARRIDTVREREVEA
jgi:hypothetical protein